MNGNTLGRMALSATGVAVGLMVATAALGSSAAEIPLPAQPDDWPVVAHAHPSAWAVTALSFAIVVASTIGVVAALAALRRGWAPDPRKLLIGGFIAVAVLVAVPPIGSADVTDYASYGHAVDRGVDPYSIPPNRQPGDPIARAVERPWRGVTSAYGPLATVEENVLTELAHDRLRTLIALLVLTHGVAFALAGTVAYKTTGTEERRRRAVLLFGLNPLLLYAVVAGGHIDSLSVLAIAAAFVLLRRWPGAAGVAGAAAMLVKVSAALPVGAWVLALRRTPRRAAAVGVGAGVAFTAGYGVVGLHALKQVRRASRYVSPATPWRALRAMHVVVGHAAANEIIRVLAPLVGLALIASIHRNLQRDRAVEADALAQVALAWTLGWTLTAPYVLSWYDALPWLFVAVVASTQYDNILVAHTATLAAVYLPGRAASAVHMPHSLVSVTDAVKTGVAPVILAALVVATFEPNILNRLRHRQPHVEPSVVA